MFSCQTTQARGDASCPARPDKVSWLASRDTSCLACRNMPCPVGQNTPHLARPNNLVWQDETRFVMKNKCASSATQDVCFLARPFHVLPDKTWNVWQDKRCLVLPDRTHCSCHVLYCSARHVLSGKVRHVLSCRAEHARDKRRHALFGKASHAKHA